jgi:hypothetical protein
MSTIVAMIDAISETVEVSCELCDVSNKHVADDIKVFRQPPYCNTPPIPPITQPDFWT